MVARKVETSYLPTVPLTSEETTWPRLVAWIQEEILPRLDAQGSSLFFPPSRPAGAEATVVPLYDVYERSTPRQALVPQFRYITSGRGCILVNDQVWLPSAGEGVYIPAGATYYPHAALQGTIWSSTCLRFGIEQHGILIEQCRVTPTQHQTGLRHFVADPRLPELFRQWEAEAVSAGRRHSLAAKGYLMAFFGLVAASQPHPLDLEERLPDGFAGFPEPLQRAVQMLHRVYGRPVRLRDLGRWCAVSPFYLCRLFRKYLNTTPLAYLTNLRMQAARELLQTTDLSATHIAFLVGYPHMPQFRRAFFKTFGLPPSAVRPGSARRRTVGLEPPDEKVKI